MTIQVHVQHLVVGVAKPNYIGIRILVWFKLGFCYSYFLHVHWGKLNYGGIGWVFWVRVRFLWNNNLFILSVFLFILFDLIDYLVKNFFFFILWFVLFISCFINLFLLLQQFNFFVFLFFSLLFLFNLSFSFNSWFVLSNTTRLFMSIANLKGILPVFLCKHLKNRFTFSIQILISLTSNLHRNHNQIQTIRTSLHPWIVLHYSNWMFLLFNSHECTGWIHIGRQLYTVGFTWKRLACYQVDSDYADVVCCFFNFLFFFRMICLMLLVCRFFSSFLLLLYIVLVFQTDNKRLMCFKWSSIHINSDTLEYALRIKIHRLNIHIFIYNVGATKHGSNSWKCLCVFTRSINATKHRWVSIIADRP